jgi:hypothetical protein
VLSLEGFTAFDLAAALREITQTMEVINQHLATITRAVGTAIIEPRISNGTKYRLSKKSKNCHSLKIDISSSTPEKKTFGYPACL